MRKHHGTPRMLTAVSLAAARHYLLPMTRAAADGERFVITQHGRPEAVLVGAAEYFAAPAARVGAVVLAASGSRRRTPAPAAAVAGLCVRLHRCGFAPVTVVAEANDRKLLAALANLEVAVTFSVSDNTGFSSSLKRGVRFIAPWCEALLVAFATMPDVRAVTLRRLLAAWQQKRQGIVVPEHQGRRGHPVLLASGYAGQLLALDPRWGLQTFMRRHQADIGTVSVADAAVLKRKDR